MGVAAGDVWEAVDREMYIVHVGIDIMKNWRWWSNNVQNYKDIGWTYRTQGILSKTLAHPDGGCVLGSQLVICVLPLLLNPV